jgi:hypothetical protein
MELQANSCMPGESPLGSHIWRLKPRIDAGLAIPILVFTAAFGAQTHPVINSGRGNRQ